MFRCLDLTRATTFLTVGKITFVGIFFANIRERKIRYLKLPKEQKDDEMDIGQLSCSLEAPVKSKRDLFLID